MSQISENNWTKIVTIGIRDIIIALGQMVNADWHSFTEVSDFMLVYPSWCAHLEALLTKQGWGGCKSYKIRSSSKTSCGSVQIHQEWHNGLVFSLEFLDASIKGCFCQACQCKQGSCIEKWHLSCPLGHWAAFLLHKVPFCEDTWAFTNRIRSPKPVFTYIALNHRQHDWD